MDWIFLIYKLILVLFVTGAIIFPFIPKCRRKAKEIAIDNDLSELEDILDIIDTGFENIGQVYGIFFIYSFIVLIATAMLAIILPILFFIWPLVLIIIILTSLFYRFNRNKNN